MWDHWDQVAQGNDGAPSDAPLKSGSQVSIRIASHSNLSDLISIVLVDPGSLRKMPSCSVFEIVALSTEIDCVLAQNTLNAL